MSQKKLCFVVVLSSKPIFFFVRGSPSCALQLTTLLWTNQRRKVSMCLTWPHLLTAWCPSYSTGWSIRRIFSSVQRSYSQVPFKAVLPKHLWHLVAVPLSLRSASKCIMIVLFFSTTKFGGWFNKNIKYDIKCHHVLDSSADLLIFLIFFFWWTGFLKISENSGT